MICFEFFQTEYFYLKQHYAQETADDTQQGTNRGVEQFVLEQNQSRTTHQSVDQDGEGQRYDGIELEEHGEGKEHTNGGTSRRGVCADLEEEVAQCAQDLNDQSANDDAQGVARHTHIIDHVEQGAVADDRKDVGYKAALAFAHLVMCPSVDFTIQIDAKPGRGNSHQIDHRQHI